MKKEIEKKVKELCDEAGSAAAQEIRGSITDDLEERYDQRVRAGMSELDAYRDVLKNVDYIRDMLKSLPLTEDEARGKMHEEGRKYNEKKLDSICSALWLLVVIAYILGSFATGHWEITWIIFLWGAVGQNLMDMVKKYNRGTPLKKVIRKGLSTIIWLFITMFYFVISFGMGGWHITWIVFLIGAFIEKIIDLFFKD